MKTLEEKRKAEIKELKKFNSFLKMNDPFPNATGVLLSDKIRYLAEKHKLIDPFVEEQLKPACYTLTVGDEYCLGGEYYSATNPYEIIKIKPFEVLVIKTTERVCIPRYMIARWNIRVNCAYKGLLWVGGPQVDPGYKGHLFCPLYNLSDKPIHLPIGEPIASIDFAKTTKLDKSDVPGKIKSEQVDIKKYDDIPKRVIIEDYDIRELKSALYTKAGQKIEKFGEEINKYENRFNAFTTITFATLAIVVSALTILPNNGDREISPSVWGGLVVALSAFAVMLSLFQYFGKYIESLDPILKYRARAILICIFIAIFTGIIAAKYIYI